MVRRGHVSLVLLLGLAGASSLPAQNVLSNPEFNTEIVPWNSQFSNDVWDAVDSRGCPGSGAYEVLCDFADLIETGECLPYSGATAHLSFRLDSSAEIPGSEGFGFSVSMYSDTDCTNDLLGFPIFVGYQFVDIPTTFATYNLQQTLSVGTQSIRVGFALSDMGCLAADGVLLYVDSLYYGQGNRILEHDFENGDVCPFVHGT